GFQLIEIGTRFARVVDERADGAWFTSSSTRQLPSACPIPDKVGQSTRGRAPDGTGPGLLSGLSVRASPDNLRPAAVPLRRISSAAGAAAPAGPPRDPFASHRAPFSDHPPRPRAREPPFRQFPPANGGPVPGRPPMPSCLGVPSPTPGVAPSGPAQRKSPPSR